MLEKIKRTDLFCNYYEQWITVYKEGAISKVTMDKYWSYVNILDTKSQTFLCCTSS